MPFVVKLLDIRVVPYILALNGADTFAAKADFLNNILAHQIAPCRPALYGQIREVIFEAGLFQLGFCPELHLYGLGLSVVVGREPYYLAARFSCGDVVLLLSCHRGHAEALGVVDRSLALAVDNIIHGPGISSVEDIYIQEVLAEESLGLDLGDAVLAVPAYHYDFREVRAVADILSAVVLLEGGAHKAFCKICLQFGVVVDNLGGRNGLESGQFCLAGEVCSPFFLQILEPGYGVGVDSVYI